MDEMEIIDFDEVNIEDVPAGDKPVGTENEDASADTGADAYMTGSEDEIEDFLGRQDKKRRRSLRKGRGALLTLLIITLLAGLGVGGYFVYDDYTGRVYTHCVIEAGDVEVAPEDFLKNPDKAVAFAEGYDVSQIDTKVPGDYMVKLSSDIYKYDCILTVEDTTPPTAEAVPVTIEYGQTAEPADFTDGVYDVSEVRTEYTAEPDYTKGGESSVGIRLTDASGNVTELETTLTVIPIHREVSIESGDELPSLDAFLLDEMAEDNKSASLVTDMSAIDTLIPGEYPVSVRIAGGIYDSILSIRDTIPPVIVTMDFEGYTTSDITPESLIESAEDVTELKYSFKEEPDLSHEGVQEVTVVATDMGGNTTEGTSVLTLMLDTEAPVIEGVKDITIMQNYPISYRDGITVTDNCDENIVLKINADAVNIKELGSYEIVYSATDRAGNSTEIPATLTIIEERYDVDTVYALAAQTLAEITTPEMSNMEKITAIYWYVKKNTSYVESDNKDDWVKAAYYGLALHKGDCYAYCASAKAMFDVLGIPNMIIDTYPLRIIHFWNLVDLGEGWRHFDATPRIGGGEFLYVDDATITAYSVTHGNSHIYDRNRFPGIQ